MEADDGHVGAAFVYTRDGPLAEFVRRNIAAHYIGQPYGEPEVLHWAAAWSNNAVLASGLGTGALSLVDLAACDLASRGADESIAAYLAASCGLCRRLRSSAILHSSLRSGWPSRSRPCMLPDGGVFKQPIVATPEDTLRAACEAMGPDCWLGMDCNWVFKSSAEAIEFAHTIGDVGLGWMGGHRPAWRRSDGRRDPLRLAPAGGDG